MMMTALMTMEEAAARGIDRVRDWRWAGAMDHAKIDIIDGKPGPWAHLYRPCNVELNGRDPVDVPITQVSPGGKVVRYDGPLPDSAEYRAEAAKWAGRVRR